MEFEKLIEERFSVRSFEERHLESKDIKKLLNAGEKAPTGCNFQPQRILVLNTDNAIEKLKECTKCHFDAKSAFVVCYNRDESWIRKYDGALSAPIDASIVATHIMLEAHNIGLGCCWVMHFDPEKTRENFNIPQNIEPLAILVLGYPSKNATPLDMHYKAKSSDEIVCYDTF